MEPTEPLDSGTPQPDAERGHAPSIHTVTPVRSASRAGRDALMALAGGGVVLAVVFGLRDRLFTPPPAPTATPVAVGDAVINEAAETVVALSSDAPAGSLAKSRQGLGAFPVRDINGSTVPIVNDGEPAIVMINSRTCGYCKIALRDLGQYANGRSASRLRMLTLEGAPDGLPMLQAANIRGAVPLGPATSQSQVLLTFRYRGTPTFVAVDGEGRIRGTMAGYPGPERLVSWFDVMLGERAAPVLTN
jgi:hypothetical protein